jgi:hypothetical protein
VLHGPGNAKPEKENAAPGRSGTGGADKKIKEFSEKP